MTRKPSVTTAGQQSLQVEKFRDLARQLECDESEDAFRATLRKVATAPRPAKPDKPA